MAELFANVLAETDGKITTLASSLDGSSTSISTAGAFPAALRSGTCRIRIDDELMVATVDGSGSVTSVTRGAEGSTATTHASGARVRHVVTAASLVAAQTGSSNVFLSETEPADPVDPSLWIPIVWLDGARVLAPVEDWQAFISTPAPTNTVAPALSGTASTGHTLTCGDGTWDGDPQTFTYQWQHDLGAGFVDITGETAATYGPLDSGDVDNPLRCQVTATNTGGSTSANSDTVTPIVSAVNPDSIFGADLVGWWRASDTPGADGDPVASAPITVGAEGPLLQATSGKQPVLKLAILNGKSVWRLDGINDKLKVILSAAVSPPYTVGIVFKARTAIASPEAVVAFNSSAWVFLGSDGNYSVNFENSSFVTAPNTALPAAFHAWTAAESVGGGVLRADGTIPAGTSGSHPSPADAVYITIGNDDSETYPSDIDVAEVWLAKRVPTAGDRTDLATYNNSEYGL